MRLLIKHAALCATLLCLSALGSGQGSTAKPSDPAVAAFERRVDDFLRQRNQAEKSALQIDHKSTSQEITAHRQQLAQELRKRRNGAHAGDVFGPELTRRISKVLQVHLQHPASSARKAVEDDKPKETATKVAVNGPYPAEGRAMMPPDILAVLPPVKDGLEYRFVKDDLLLVDTKSELVVDIVPAVLR